VNTLISNSYHNFHRHGRIAPFPLPNPDPAALLEHPVRISPRSQAAGVPPPAESTPLPTQMKKVLAETQKKMENRINLFRKASQKIIKQQELNCKVFIKVEAAREQHILPRYIQNDYQPRSQSAARPRNKRDPNESADSMALADRLQQERVNKARCLKEERSRLRGNHVEIQ
jgi:hypothetical protein